MYETRVGRKNEIKEGKLYVSLTYLLFCVLVFLYMLKSFTFLLKKNLFYVVMLNLREINLITRDGLKIFARNFLIPSRFCHIYIKKRKIDK